MNLQEQVLLITIDEPENKLEITESYDGSCASRNICASIEHSLIPHITKQCQRNFLILCVITDIIRISFIFLYFLLIISQYHDHSTKLFITMLFVIPYSVGVVLWTLTLLLEDIDPFCIKYIFPPTENKYFKLLKNIIQSFCATALNIIFNHFWLFYAPVSIIIEGKTGTLDKAEELMCYLNSSKNKAHIRQKIIAINYSFIDKYIDHDHKFTEHIKKLYNVQHHCKNITFSSMRDLYCNLNPPQSTFYHALVSLYFYNYKTNNTNSPKYFYPMLFGLVLCGSIIITCFPCIQLLFAFTMEHKLQNIFIYHIVVYIICEILFLLITFLLFYPNCYYLYHILPNGGRIPMDAINIEYINVQYDKLFVNYERYTMVEQLFGKEIAHIVLMYFKDPLGPLQEQQANNTNNSEVRCWNYATALESWSTKTKFENIDKVGYLCECSGINTGIGEEKVYPATVDYITPNKIFVSSGYGWIDSRTHMHVLCPYATRYGWIDIPNYRLYAPPAKHVVNTGYSE